MQKDTNNKNLILAIALSTLVIVGWNYFYGMPQVNKQRQEAQPPATQSLQVPGGAGPVQAPGSAAAPAPSLAPSAAPLRDRAVVLNEGARIAIDTPRLVGTISLKGGRIDDLSLRNYRETVDPKSANIVLFSPDGAANAYYADFGWLAPQGTNVATPTAATLWSTQDKALSVGKPVTLTYDNGQGLIFKRQIAVDENFLFTVADSVENKSNAAVTLHPYGQITRQGQPQTLGFYILHEGMIGVLGDQGLQEITYPDMNKAKSKVLQANSGWLGMTDKYWAAALLPEQGKPFTARFESLGANPVYHADILQDGLTVAPNAGISATTQLFAGAKEVAVIDKYETTLGVKKFDLLIDWGWFHFITKPLFWLMTSLYKLVGNFGITILLVTVIIKAAFFPLANKSYESMAKMKAVQPQMNDIRERFAEDKMAQQQALMELYKKEKINPLSGCLPVLILIPVFFALYKVLFVTIEMRHAPFFGWIKDLAAPDPTSVFNLFGLLPYQVPDISYFHIGVWPVIMGITMWLQMKMNPEPQDPVQKAVFGWMPLIFTFMLGTFPAGLVIYWAWNNILSVSQQYMIMKKNGVKVELWDNLRKMFRKASAEKS